MNYRETALQAINHTAPPSVPADVWENGIHPILAENLLDRLLIPREGGRKDYRKILKTLGASFRWATCVYAGPEMETLDLPYKPAFPFLKISRNIWGTIDGIETYADSFDRPLANARSVRDIESHRWPDPDWFDYDRVSWFIDGWETIYTMTEWAEAERDYVRLVGGWNPVFSRVMDLFGMENGLVALMSEPALVEAAVANIGDFLEGYYGRLARSALGKADILGFGDDFAGQNGMLLHPDLWRKLFLPLWKKLFAIGHKHGLKNMMHMCGGIRDIIPDLIDAGLDIYENLQTTPPGMEPAALKKDFGKDLVFYGGIDVQHVLPSATPDEVREEVRRMAETMEGDGGYIVASTHFLLDDIPAENVIAMYEAAGTLVSQG
jgi:uroporphyrinogen decarboxylase